MLRNYMIGQGLGLVFLITVLAANCAAANVEVEYLEGKTYQKNNFPDQLSGTAAYVRPVAKKCCGNTRQCLPTPPARWVLR